MNEQAYGLPTRLFLKSQDKGVYSDCVSKGNEDAYILKIKLKTSKYCTTAFSLELSLLLAR